MSEILSHTKFHGFNQKFEIQPEGLFGITEDEVNQADVLDPSPQKTIGQNAHVRKFEQP